MGKMYAVANLITGETRVYGEEHPRDFEAGARMLSSGWMAVEGEDEADALEKAKQLIREYPNDTEPS